MGIGSEQWIAKGERRVADCRIFSVATRTSVSPGGAERESAVGAAPDWATVLPVTLVDGEAHFILVRQWRHGSDAVSVEFPGGAVEPGEDPEAGVARELREETGYAAGRIVKLGTMSPNPAFMRNRFHVYLAEGCVPASGQELDDDELVDVLLEPVADVLEKMGKPPYDHALMAAACHLYERHRRSNG